MLAHHLFTMACNNAWANLRLLRAVGQLTDEEFAAPRTGFFPSIRATLNHTLTVDWFYVDALERAWDGRPVNPDARAFFDPEEPCATCRDLAPAQRAVDQRLIAALRDLPDTKLLTPVGVQRRAGVSWDRADRLLAHLLQHQLHHRGQVHAMLAGTSVAPPQLDEFFCAGEAHLRADELAALGLSDDDVWGRPPG